MPLRPHHYPIALLTAALAIAGLAALWSGLGLSLRSACAWMALIAALDAAVLMRLAGLPAGRARCLIVLSTTLLALPVSIYCVGATQVGALFGVRPHEALWMTGPDLALTWWRLNTAHYDLAFPLLSLPLAWWLDRRAPV